MEHMSATNGKAVHGSNHRFRNTTDLLLYIQYAQTRYTVFPDISATSFHILVASRTECLITGSGNYNHINIRFFTANAQCITHFGSGSRGKCIPITFTVDCDTGNSIIIIKKNIVVFSDGCPLSLCWHNLFLF